MTSPFGKFKDVSVERQATHAMICFSFNAPGRAGASAQGIELADGEHTFLIETLQQVACDRLGIPREVAPLVAVIDLWCARGLWQKIAAATGEADLDEIQPDATTINAHPVSSTGRRLRGEKKKTPTPAGA